jgi:hypothetical protein
MNEFLYVRQSWTKFLLKWDRCCRRIFDVSLFCFNICCVCEMMKLSLLTRTGHWFTGFFNTFTSLEYWKYEKHCSGFMFGRYLVPVLTSCWLSWLRLLQFSSLFPWEFHINIGNVYLIPNLYQFINYGHFRIWFDTVLSLQLKQHFSIS